MYCSEILHKSHSLNFKFPNIKNSSQLDTIFFTLQKGNVIHCSVQKNQTNQPVATKQNPATTAPDWAFLLIFFNILGPICLLITPKPKGLMRQRQFNIPLKNIRDKAACGCSAEHLARKLSRQWLSPWWKHLLCFSIAVWAILEIALTEHGTKSFYFPAILTLVKSAALVLSSASSASRSPGRHTLTCSHTHTHTRAVCCDLGACFVVYHRPGWGRLQNKL